jgi:serine/threonine protein kinase
MLVTRIKMNALNIEVHQLVGEGVYGQVCNSTYIKPDKNYFRGVVKMIDSVERISGSAIFEAIVLASLRHTYIMRLVEQPIIHKVFKKVRVTTSEPLKKRGFKGLPFKKRDKKGSQTSVTLEYQSPDKDITYKRLILLQEKASGDLDDIEPLQPYPARFKAIVWQLFQAVGALHSCRVIHGDIKPSNVLIFEDDRIRLTDFSLSVFMDQKNAGISGSNHYNAPEVIPDNVTWTEKVDIWSLGCLLYTIYYGDLLFPSQSVPSNLDSHDQARLHHIKQLAAICDWKEWSRYDYLTRGVDFNRVDDQQLRTNTPVNRLILSMLKVNPEERPSITTLLQDSLFSEYTSVYFELIGLPSVPLDQDIIDMIVQCGTINGRPDEVIINITISLVGRVHELISYMGKARLTRASASIVYRTLNRVVLLDLQSDSDDEDLILHFSGFRILDCFVYGLLKKE